MSDEVAFQPKAYQSLLSSISNTYENGRLRAFQSVNICLIETYWTIGQHIVEFEQGGISRAEYGRQLLEILSRDLRQRYGKGFSRSNLTRFRQFYLAYPNCATLSHKLSCSRSHAPRGNAVKARCAASHGQRLRIRDAARPALHSHVARGNEGKIVEYFRELGYARS